MKKLMTIAFIMMASNAFGMANMHTNMKVNGEQDFSIDCPYVSNYGVNPDQILQIASFEGESGQKTKSVLSN